MDQEIFATHQRFPYWARGLARIEGEEIVLDEDRAELYNILEAGYVEFALEALDETDPRSVVAFARRYGLLWHGANDLGTGECRERLSDWWKASEELRFVMVLYRSVQEAVRTGSVEPIRSLGIDWSTVELIRDSRAGWPGTVVEEEPIPEDPHSDETYFYDVCQMLDELVNSGLEDCRVGLLSLTTLDAETSQPGKFLFSVAPANLVALAYANFATLIAKRAEIRECPGCGRMFTPESGKQKYCTKSCASTSRWRRWKARQNTD